MLRSFALHWSLLLLGVKAGNVANQERFEDNPFFSKMQDISGYINKDVHTCTGLYTTWCNAKKYGKTKKDFSNALLLKLIWQNSHPMSRWSLCNT